MSLDGVSPSGQCVEKNSQIEQKNVTNKNQVSEIDQNLDQGESISGNHKTKKLDLKCEICSRLFKANSHLSNHMRIHTKDHHFQCEKCGKEYKALYRLKIHCRTHTGYKPYICSYCSKSFNEKGNLVTHIRIHNGERPFECNFIGCRNKFKTKGQLSDHLKTHTGERPYGCKICSKKFMRSSALKVHQKIHNKNRYNSHKEMEENIQEENYINIQKSQEENIQKKLELKIENQNNIHKEPKEEKVNFPDAFPKIKFELEPLNEIGHTDQQFPPQGSNFPNDIMQMPYPPNYYLPNMNPQNFVDPNSLKILNVDKHDSVIQSELNQNPPPTKKKRSEKLNLAKVNSIQDSNKYIAKRSLESMYFSPCEPFFSRNTILNSQFLPNYSFAFSPPISGPLCYGFNNLFSPALNFSITPSKKDINGNTNSNTNIMAQYNDYQYFSFKDPQNPN